MGEFKCAFLYGKPHRFEAFKWHEEENRAKKERKTGHEKKAKKLRRKGEGTKKKRRRFIFYFSPFLKLFLKFYYSFFSFLFIHIFKFYFAPFSTSLFAPLYPEKPVSNVCFSIHIVAILQNVNYYLNFLYEY